MGRNRLARSCGAKVLELPDYSLEITMKTAWKYSFYVLGLVLLTTARAHACDNLAPEVDPNMAIGGITLLAGTLAVLRSRFHR